jgi:glycosyltransferase involved in cell wall biosynthesis
MKTHDDSKTPFFTVVTCTFNSARYLEENIASVEGQTYRNFEHVFIDAFSSDETLRIIHDYKKRCPDIVKVFQFPPKGISNAMNEGINCATGKVIVHLHSDDRLDSETVLFRVAEIFNEKAPSILIGNCRLLGLDSERFTWAGGKFKFLWIKLLFKPLMFYSNLVPHPSTYVSRQVFDRNGKFLEKYRVVMDYEFWLRVFKTENWIITEHILSSYRFHDGTISNQQKELGVKELEAIRSIYKSQYKFAYGIFILLLKPILFSRRILKSWL